MSLIVTIIVLIILASITILSLANTKLFSKAREGTDKYKVAQQDEINTLNEYNSYISDNSRETITIDKSEYEKLKLINKPNLWEVGKEYNFGDGVYGQHFKGTITSGVNVHTSILLDANGENYKTIIYGGYFERGDGVLLSAFSNDNNSTGSSIVNRNDGMRFESKGDVARTNSIYDIWVLYTKN